MVMYDVGPRDKFFSSAEWKWKVSTPSDGPLSCEIYQRRRAKNRNPSAIVAIEPKYEIGLVFIHIFWFVYHVHSHRSCINLYWSERRARYTYFSHWCWYWRSWNRSIAGSATFRLYTQNTQNTHTFARTHSESSECAVRRALYEAPTQWQLRSECVDTPFGGCVCVSECVYVWVRPHNWNFHSFEDGNSRQCSIEQHLESE